MIRILFDDLIFKIFIILSMGQIMGEITTCSNCGLKFDSGESSCTHCNFTIVERAPPSKDDIEEEFDL